MNGEFPLSPLVFVMFNELFTHEFTSTIHSSPLDRIPLVGPDPGLIPFVSSELLTFLLLKVYFNFSSSVVLPRSGIAFSAKTFHTRWTP
jgi:hypothetical protein